MYIKATLGRPKLLNVFWVYCVIGPFPWCEMSVLYKGKLGSVVQEGVS